MKLHDYKIKLLNYLWLSNQNQKGFTLLEVLIALLTVTLFVAFSLEGMVMASLVQIRAREKAEASLLIQRNLEEIRAVAVNYAPSGAELTARCNGTGGASSNEGLAAGLSAQISADSNLDIANTVTLKVSERSYPFQRTMTPSATNRNLLQVRYQVTDSVTSNRLVELYTEVIPDVSLDCP